MKKIECIVRVGRFEQVKKALQSINVEGMTVYKVKGYGKQKGQRDVYMGVEYTIELVPKVKIELVVTDDRVDGVVQAICEAARTGQVGDGKIFIYDVQDAVRIRTGERGVASI